MLPDTPRYRKIVPIELSDSCLPEWRTSGISKDLYITCPLFLSDENWWWWPRLPRSGSSIQYTSAWYVIQVCSLGVSRTIQNIDTGNSLLLCHYKFRQSNDPYSYGLVNDHSTEWGSKFVLSLVLGVSSRVLFLSCLSSVAHPRRWKFFSTWVLHSCVRYFILLLPGPCRIFSSKVCADF